MQRMQKKFAYTFSAVTAKGGSLDKGGRERLNEDTFVANVDTGIFAVFDGATSLVPTTRADGRTGAFLAANIAMETFEKGEGKDLFDLLMEANSRIRAQMVDSGVDLSDKLNLWSTSVAAVKVKEDSFDWLQVSDSIILVLYNDGAYKLLTSDYSHDTELLVRFKKASENGAENPRAEIMDDIIRSRRNANITHGLLNGEKEIKFVQQGTERLANVKSILIFSDGMLIPKRDPRAAEDFGMVAAQYRRAGLKGWLEYVRRLQDSDPKCVKYPRTKMHDDATAVAIEFK